MSNDVLSDIKRMHIMSLLESGKRVDGRGFEERRKIELMPNFVPRAEGSARLRLGDTDVLAGIKMDTGTPFSDTPDTGVMTTNIELIPMASPFFESGPPRPAAIEISRVVDRGIRESHTVNMSKLCITPGEEVWIMFIDIHTLDYDGNLFDAASLAALAALKNTTVPAGKFEKGEDYPLPVEHLPVASTFVKIGDKILLDPNYDEEQVASARLTITFDENGDLRAMQKGIGGGFTNEEIFYMMKVARKTSRELMEELF